MGYVKRVALILIRLSIFTFCGLASAYILASGYESIYDRPLPYVDTIAAVNLTAFTDTLRLNTVPADPKLSYYGNFGKPITLKLPSSSLRLNIVSAIQDGSSWLARPGTLQLLIPSRPRDGNIGVALLYCRSNFRTINAANMPKPNQNIFMDTDQDWRYIYKINAVHVYTADVSYVPSDDGSTGKILIDCNDSGTKNNIIVEGSLLSVQGVEQ